MNERRKIHHGSLLFLVVMLTAVLSSGCGVDDPTGKTSRTAGSVVTTGTPTIGANLCLQCHPSVGADWQLSRHGNLNSTPSYTTTAFCAGCHDKNGDSQQFTPNRMVVGCESCHGPGSLHYDRGGTGPIMTAVFSAGPIGGVTSSLDVSGQFQTCHQCHQLLLADDPASATTPTSAMHSSVAGSVRVITDTHFSTPNAWSSLNGNNNSTSLFAVTGYALDYTSESSCTACHNPHGVININQEWAASAHAARFSLGKDPQGYFSDAWSHYNWSCDATSTAGCGSFGTPSDRRSCQRCHTTSGFKAYADALRTGNSSLADQIRAGQLSTIVTYTAGWKPEMLKCDSCHTDFKGTLRNPGPITAEYGYAFPDASKSNVCLACHTGRESGDSIKASTSDFNNTSFINSHYLTGGGTVFTATGYEFDGRSYANPLSYQHDHIGMDDFRSTGTTGPCVGCHMSRPNGNGDHLYLPVSRFNRVRDNDGTVALNQGSATVTGTGTTWAAAGIDTAADAFLGPDGRTYLIANVNSDVLITLTSAYRGNTASNQLYVIAKDGARITGIASEVCFNCHAGATSALVDQLNEEREMFEAALTATELFLDTSGICFVEAYPYFHKKRYDSGKVNATAGNTIVTGASTTWTSASIFVYTAATSTTDQIRMPDGEAYGIFTVDNDNQITLMSPYRGPTVTNAPYTIMTTGSGNAVKDWDITDQGETYGKNFMGAAFNFNLMEHDPGAYVHNRTYAKRLLYDTIDWLDDMEMNFSVGASLDGLSDTVYATWKHEAMTYLLPNGVLGIPAERP